MELMFWQLAEKIWQLVYFDSWYQLDTVGVKLFRREFIPTKFMFLIEISLLLFLISGAELNGKERGTLGGQGDKRGLNKYISNE